MGETGDDPKKGRPLSFAFCFSLQRFFRRWYGVAQCYWLPGTTGTAHAVPWRPHPAIQGFHLENPSPKRVPFRKLTGPNWPNGVAGLWKDTSKTQLWIWIVDLVGKLLCHGRGEAAWLLGGVQLRQSKGGCVARSSLGFQLASQLAISDALWHFPQGHGPAWSSELLSWSSPSL